MYIDNVVIEITRRCNMACLHCLRGEPEARSISDKIINRFFLHLRGDSIGTLTITGGEPSLAPSRIQAIVQAIRWSGVEVNSFYMVTNGKRCPPAFVKAVNDLYNVCSDQGSCCLHYSNDMFHDKGYKEVHDKFECYEFFKGGKDSKDWPLNYDKLINEGRSREEWIGRKELEMDRYLVIPDDDPDECAGVREGLFYINALGKVLPSCDMSYESQRHPNVILGDVFDEDFNLCRYAEEFNAKLDLLEPKPVDGDTIVKTFDPDGLGQHDEILHKAFKEHPAYRRSRRATITELKEMEVAA